MARILEEDASGAVVYQITDDSLEKSNIYCEQPYCSADSRVFVYEQQNPKPGPNHTEYVTCEFGTWKREVVGQGLRAPGMSHTGIFYYRHVREGKCLELRRVDLATGKWEVIFEFPEDFQHRGMDTVSPDERYYAYGVTLSLEPQMFGIELLDLKTGTRDLIHTDPDICNPHTQFEPTWGKQIMVQHNRGCKVLPDGTRAVIFGEQGATEFLLDIPSGKVTRLQVGEPYTPSIVGHEAWIAGTNEILLTVRAPNARGLHSPEEWYFAEGDYTPEKGNLLGVKAGEPPRSVSRGYRFNHLGTSPCGQYFFADDWQGSGKLILGSIQTGKNAVVCDARTSILVKKAHPHAYATPDMQWMVFTSDLSGQPQIHVASIPSDLVNGLNGTAN